MHEISEKSDKFSLNSNLFSGALFSGHSMKCGCSSGVIWERKKRKRYTSVTMLMNQILEEGYQRYQNELELARGHKKVEGRRVLPDGKVEVVCDHSHLLYFYPPFSSLWNKTVKINIRLT